MADFLFSSKKSALIALFMASDICESARRCYADIHQSAFPDGAGCVASKTETE